MEQAKALGYSSEVQSTSLFRAGVAARRKRPETAEPGVSPTGRSGPCRRRCSGTIAPERCSSTTCGRCWRARTRRRPPIALKCIAFPCCWGSKVSTLLPPASVTDRARGAGGAWGQSPGGEIPTLIRQAREKIDRIRGPVSFLPDAPAPPGETDRHRGSLEPRSGYRGAGSFGDCAPGFRRVLVGLKFGSRAHRLTLVVRSWVPRPRF